MAQRLFFGRHAQTKDEIITELGMRRLENLRTRLEARGFVPQFGISSHMTRARETARYLSYGKDPVILKTLTAFGDLHEIGVFGNPEIMPVREYAVRACDELLTLIGDDDCAIISHDYTSLFLGRRFLELNGMKDAWLFMDASDESFPNQGEGWLIEGTSCEMFMNKA